MPVHFTFCLEQNIVSKVLRDGDFHLLRFWLALFWFVGDLVSLSCSLGTHAIFSSSLPVALLS